jgi:hypothetical protein
LLLIKLLRSDINSAEGQDYVFPENSACDSIPISLAEVVLRKICADDRRLLFIKTRVDDVVETRDSKLITDLSAKVVDNKEVT